MPPLAVYLLGAPRIEADGQPIEVDTRKATALVAYLAMDGQPRSRDALAELLWPDAESGRAALRRTLSVLGKALGGRFLAVERDSIGLQGGPEVWVDVRDFEAGLKGCPNHRGVARDDCADCLAALGRAVIVYRGDFLEGFSLRDSDRFDEWRFFQAERLRRQLGQALQRLVRGHAGRREYSTAIEFAQRWLGLDPLHEPAHRALMRLYARSGQRSAALRQYRECVRVLDRELGVAPLDETTRLYEAIKEDRKEDRRPGRDGEAVDVPPASPEPTAPPPAARPTEYPLVGRGADWQTLLRAYDTCGRGGRVLAIEGEAGIGKTRLAESLIEHARANGAKVLAARCFPGEGDLAFAPFLDGLRAALDRADHDGWLAAAPAHGVAEAARLRPELADLRPGLPPAPPLDSPGSQARFFEGVWQVLLAATAGDRPGIFFLDDLQWADRSSLDLLAYLVRRLRDQPRCILITWRPEEAPAGHRLRQILGEADRAGRATTVRLRRLDVGALRQLVAGLESPGLSDSPDFVERLYRETEGLPFLVVAYLADLIHDGRALDARWSLPSSGRDLLRARLAGLGDTAGQLLGAAAVIGRSFDFDILRSASGRSDDEAVAALDELVGRGLVVEVTGGPDGPAPSQATLSYDFSHEKLRSLVYDETSLARRRLLHRRVADALAGRRRTHRGAELGAIARHYQLAGDDELAATYFKQAGERARSLYANSEAVAHFRAALALGHPEAAALHEAIGDVQTLLGEYGAARRSYETAASLGEAADVGRLEHKLGTVYHRRGEWDLAESHFAAALAQLDDGGSAAARARLSADWSLTAHRLGRADDARDLAARALELAQSAGDGRALARAHNLLGILATSAGDLERARRHLEESLTLAEGSADPDGRVAARNNLALACAAGGDTVRAIHLAEEALAISQGQGDRHREAALHNNLADLFHATGNSAVALEHLKHSVAIYAEIGVEAGNLQPEIWKLTEW